MCTVYTLIFHALHCFSIKLERLWPAVLLVLLMKDLLLELTIYPIFFLKKTGDWVAHVFIPSMDMDTSKYQPSSRIVLQHDIRLVHRLRFCLSGIPEYVVCLHAWTKIYHAIWRTLLNDYVHFMSLWFTGLSYCW